MSNTIMKQYNATKLANIENKLNERVNILEKCIRQALSARHMTEYDRLKSEKDKCLAQIRLIEYIKNDMEGDFLIV